MSVRRWGQCSLLLVLLCASLAVRDPQPNSPGVWPTLGLAIALLLVAGPQWLRQVLVLEAVVVAVAVILSYGVSPWTAALGSLAVIVPAWIGHRLLATPVPGQLRLDEVDSDRYHLVTALTALLSGVTGMLATVGRHPAEDVLRIGLLTFLPALTGQLAILPLLVRGSSRPSAGGPAELFAQRSMLLLTVVLAFGPTSRLSVVFVIFPMLGWAANRATRRESHWQLFLVCLTAYVLTLSGRGPFAGPIPGVPEELGPVLIHLFLAAACYMSVPLSMTVERLVAMTSQATRAATTVERLLDSVSGAMIIATDAEGRITHFNTGAQETLGYTPDEVLGGSPAMFYTAAEIRRQAVHFGVPADYATIVLEMVRRGERRDWEFIRKDRCPRMASLTLSEVTDNDGDVIGYIGAGDDITERLRAEDALLTALEREHASVLRLREVDNVKQELVSNVSHELRTPITSIAGYTELLADSSLGDLSPEQVDAVERIGRNAERLGLLVEDLLTLSRVEAGQLEMEREEIDLRTVAEEALEQLRELLQGGAADVRVELPDEPVLVSGDNRGLERVAVNLLSNAVKFTPGDGTVTIAVAREGDDASLTVQDTGMGISEEDQEHLFTRFFRTSTATEHAIQGTGLGLSIVHSIITQHGGTVSVSSVLGSGTTVTVHLPHLA